MFRRIAAVLMLVVTSRAHADRVDLGAIIAHPKKFNGLEVTVTGLAADNGNGLYVFATFEAASKSARNTQDAVYVPGPFKRDYNRHWVEITGVVQAGRHGWAGQNPCEIKMTHFRDLYPEKRVLWPQDIGFFLNATSSSIIVDSEVAGGGSTGTELGPHQTGTAVITPSGQLVVYKSADMKIMFTADLQYPTRRPEDPSERGFRFVVREHRLEFLGKAKAGR